MLIIRSKTNATCTAWTVGPAWQMLRMCSATARLPSTAAGAIFTTGCRKVGTCKQHLLKVKIWIVSDDLANHNLDNTAINSLTVTIVSVSIVSVALVAVLVYLLVFLLHRRRVTSPFKHRRMNDGSRPRSNNMEFANRMFLQDDDDVSEEQGAFTMEELEPSTNFVNPVYETMFQVSTTAPNNRNIIS